MATHCLVSLSPREFLSLGMVPMQMGSHARSREETNAHWITTPSCSSPACSGQCKEGQQHGLDSASFLVSMFFKSSCQNDFSRRNKLEGAWTRHKKMLH